MKFNILVVDDSKTVRAVVKKTLSLAGVPIQEYHEAANGKEALEILNEEWIDIVFADINMPIMGGIEMVEKMADNGLMKTIPVIIISTEGSKSRIEKLKSKGVSAYLRKPFTPELLKKVVDDILGVKNAGE